MAFLHNREAEAHEILSGSLLLHRFDAPYKCTVD